MSSVPAVAFAWMNPEALRVFLDIRGFNLRVASGDMAAIQELDAAQKDRNIVILPNFQKRHLLADHADKIGCLLLLTNGRHEDVLRAGIPILDADVMQDGEIQKHNARKADWYVQHIQSDAKDLALVSDLPKPKKVKASTAIAQLETLDHWMTYIDQHVSDGIDDFAVDIDQPVCLYLVGELQRSELEDALKALVKRGASKKVLKRFFVWLDPDYADRMRKALHYRLHPKNVDNMPDVKRLAKKLSLDSNDIRLLEAIYGEIKLEEREGQSPLP